MSFFITADCEKCGECIQSCPVGVISPDYVIDRDECIYCGACLNVCPYDAIEEIGPGDHIRKTAYDPENENVQKCLEAKTTEEAVSCFPPEVARPYEYISEVSGPASVELKRALLSRKKYLETQRSYDAEARAEANTGTIAVLILAAISVLIYCMETFMGQYEGKTWYTLLAIVLFFAMIIIISYLFFVHTELDLFGIGAAVVITIVYIKYMHKIPVFIGMMVLCLAAILYLRLSLAARDRRGMGSMEEYDRRISEAADAMFKAFRDNIIDFGWEWSDISPTHTDIWKEAAKAVYGQGTLTDAQLAAKTEKKLFLRLERGRMESVTAMLALSAGNVPVYMHIPEEKITLLAPREQWCDAGEECVRRLQEALGAENVVLK